MKHFGDYKTCVLCRKPWACAVISVISLGAKGDIVTPTPLPSPTYSALMSDSWVQHELPFLQFFHFPGVKCPTSPFMRAPMLLTRLILKLSKVYKIWGFFDISNSKSFGIEVLLFKMLFIKVILCRCPNAYCNILGYRKRSNLNSAVLALLLQRLEYLPSSLRRGAKFVLS